jgi:hypothetical protein
MSSLLMVRVIRGRRGGVGREKASKQCSVMIFSSQQKLNEGAKRRI